MNRIAFTLLTLSLTFGAVACKSKEEAKTEAKTEEKTEAKTEEKTEAKTEEPKGPQPTRVD